MSARLLSRAGLFAAKDDGQPVGVEDLALRLPCVLCIMHMSVYVYILVLMYRIYTYIKMRTDVSIRQLIRQVVICMYVCMYVCIYVRMYACMHACMHV